MVKIAGRDVVTSDVGVVAGGLVVLISSFLPWMGIDWFYYRGSIHMGWASGPLAVFAIVLSFAAAGLVAARMVANLRLPAIGPVGPALLTVILGAIATLFILIRLVTVHPWDSRFGLYFGLIGAAALTGFSVVGLLASGEQIPGRGPVTGAPWEQRPPYGQPYGRPYGHPGAAPAPYGPQPAAPYPQPPATGYGQPTPAPGYGQPTPIPTATPTPAPGYGQPPAPYGQPSPYGQPPQTPAPGYGQAPAPGYDPGRQQPPQAGAPYGQQPS